MDSAREGDLRVPKPERPPSRSHPVGHGNQRYIFRCVTLLTLTCILRHSECNSLPIWLSVFYGIENDALCRIVFLYNTVFGMPLFSQADIHNPHSLKFLRYTTLRIITNKAPYKQDRAPQRPPPSLCRIVLPFLA